MITEQQLVEWNEQALIAGPEETEDQYLKRVDYCLDISSTLAIRQSGELAFLPEDLASPDMIKEIYPITRYYYGTAPKWIPIFFTNHKLSPWHGGCAWIFQLSESSPTSALFQLRKQLRSKKRYLGLFDRDEIIVHEMAHVGRMMFDEPQFEEILAYRSSKSKLHRLLGPLVQSSRESAFFVLILFLLLTLDLFFVFNGDNTLFLQAMWLKLIPLGMIGAAAFRLSKRHRHFDAAFETIKTIYGDEKTANAFCYRLTDKEIITFASQSSTEITAYIRRQLPQSLRWRQIIACYPHPIFSFSH